MPSMVSENSLVLKNFRKIEAATCKSVGNEVPKIFRINPSTALKMKLLGVYTLLKMFDLERKS